MTIQIHINMHMHITHAFITLHLFLTPLPSILDPYVFVCVLSLLIGFLGHFIIIATLDNICSILSLTSLPLSLSLSLSPPPLSFSLMLYNPLSLY